jgi:hypothetical protein
VELALLTSEAETWPVLDGIAVLTDSGEDVVGLVRAGRHQDAVADLAFAERPRTRRSALLRSLSGLPKITSTQDAENGP